MVPDLMKFQFSGGVKKQTGNYDRMYRETQSAAATSSMRHMGLVRKPTKRRSSRSGPEEAVGAREHEI